MDKNQSTTHETKTFVRNGVFYFVLAFSTILVFVLGWFSQTVFARYVQNQKFSTIQIRQNSSDYHFINPLILTDNPDVESSALQPLKNIISNAISADTKAGQAKDISVYFRDLESGDTTGVNEDDLYAPSSMLKVVTLIAYAQLVGNDPEVLSQELYYKFGDDSGQFFKPSSSLSTGYHTVSQLLGQMIVYSDNTANDILDAYQPQAILNVYSTLELPDPLTSPNDFMSVEQYSRIWRSLYNSTYLPRPYSEEALQLLSSTTFDQGIVAGVASSTIVSHKFGEQTTEVGSTVTGRELHDCGIVYYPQHPYFLCMMTKGTDFPTLANVISDISSKVYQYVDANTSSTKNL